MEGVIRVRKVGRFTNLARYIKWDLEFWKITISKETIRQWFDWTYGGLPTEQVVGSLAKILGV